MNFISLTVIIIQNGGRGFKNAKVSRGRNTCYDDGLFDFEFGGIVRGGAGGGFYRVCERREECVCGNVGNASAMGEGGRIRFELGRGRAVSGMIILLRKNFKKKFNKVR